MNLRDAQEANGVIKRFLGNHSLLMEELNELLTWMNTSIKPPPEAKITKEFEEGWNLGHISSRQKLREILTKFQINNNE
jgi:hypothetical protein